MLAVATPFLVLLAACSAAHGSGGSAGSSASGRLPQLTLASASTSVAAGISPSSTATGLPPVIAGAPARPASACTVLPADNIWHAKVSGLPVDARSAAYVKSIGASSKVHPDFGSGHVRRCTVRHADHHGHDREADGHRPLHLRQRERQGPLPRCPPAPGSRGARRQPATGTSSSSTPRPAVTTSCGMRGVPDRRGRRVRGRSSTCARMRCGPRVGRPRTPPGWPSCPGSCSTARSPPAGSTTRSG